MSGALAGLKILDFTHWGVGPWGVSLLAEMGADVIKIEPPGGDWISRQPPPYKNGITTTYLACNVNKRIISLDPASELGHEVILEMVRTTDVIVENRRPGFMARRGIDYDSVRKINPRIVYCSSSGYGYEGPLAEQASSDPFGSAISGFASINGPVGGPMQGLKGGGAHIDFTTSLYIAAGILSALYRREITGEGEWVQTSQMQAAMALSGPRAQEFYVSGEDPVPMGSGVGNIVPSRAYRASDGRYVSVSAPAPATWERLCA
ncbi:MAG: CoA transferase, partial [Chloroflexi bacterium]|nr:CoA transferase [Chloroflexota bacterium]